jgi:hypothetical protein
LLFVITATGVPTFTIPSAFLILAINPLSVASNPTVALSVYT